MDVFDRIRHALAPFDNGPHCDMIQGPLLQLYLSDGVEIECAINALRARVAELEGDNARLRHHAVDLLQHVDWLTNGLPKLLEDGGLTDEEGLIAAAVDAAISARAALQEPK